MIKNCITCGNKLNPFTIQEGTVFCKRCGDNYINRLNSGQRIISNERTDSGEQSNIHQQQHRPLNKGTNSIIGAVLVGTALNAYKNNHPILAGFLGSVGIKALTRK